MSKTNFSWVKDLIDNDAKALGVYIAILNLRFWWSTENFTSISGIEPYLRFVVEGPVKSKIVGAFRLFEKESYEAYKAAKTFLRALVTNYKDLALNASSRNALLEEIEGEFFETFAKAYKKYLRLDGIPYKYRKTMALLLYKIRSGTIPSYSETISGTVAVREDILKKSLKFLLNLNDSDISALTTFLETRAIAQFAPPGYIFPAPCLMDDVLRLLEEGVIEEERGVAETKPSLTIDLNEIARLRSQSLSGLVFGYGCSDFVFRPIDVLPAGFEGKWSCCRLGCGGWGCAYLCTNGKEKAVFKVPRGFESIIEGGQELPTVHSKMLEKIRHEAEVMSGLEHPNIIKLLGYSEKAPLLIYEYADYGTLYWQLSKGWKPSLRDILLIGVQLGDALRYIHYRGLIHGDIKPSNVFIKNGVSKLGDFSSIVRLLSSVSLSKMAYTVGFRAPEQVYPNIRKGARELGVENRIDVYQLANLILYMLTGESIDGVEAVDEKHVVEKLSKVPNEELRRILAEALAPEPVKRPSAEEFTKTLYTIHKKIA